MTDHLATECPLHGAYVVLPAGEPRCPTCGLAWERLADEAWLEPKATADPQRPAA